MNQPLDISVILCTYNRCSILGQALESVVTQKADGINYEVLVIDNNSQDETRAVIESFIERGYPVRYIFESKQGLSHARNTGIENSAGPIVVFFDDDELACPGWITSIKQAFDEHPEVDFIGGKILPRWEVDPPDWLVVNYDWSPVALTDHGNKPFYSNAEKPLCLIGGNLAMRRSVFDKIGLFDAALQRVKDSIGSMEDHELLMRLWRIGGQGLYVPNMVVEAEVPIRRMSKKYYRRWHKGHGMYCALNHFVEQFDWEDRVLPEPFKCTRLFGTPTFMYRQLLQTGSSWFFRFLIRDKIPAFVKEMELLEMISYIRTSYHCNPKLPLSVEMRTFVKKLSEIAHRRYRKTFRLNRRPLHQ